MILGSELVSELTFFSLLIYFTFRVLSLIEGPPLTIGFFVELIREKTEKVHLSKNIQGPKLFNQRFFFVVNVNNTFK